MLSKPCFTWISTNHTKARNLCGILKRNRLTFKRKQNKLNVKNGPSVIMSHHWSSRATWWSMPDSKISVVRLKLLSLFSFVWYYTDVCTHEKRTANGFIIRSYGATNRISLNMVVGRWLIAPEGNFSRRCLFWNIEKQSSPSWAVVDEDVEIFSNQSSRKIEWPLRLCVIFFMLDTTFFLI